MGMWWVRSSHWSSWKLFLYDFSGVTFQCWHRGKIWKSWECMVGRLVWELWLYTSTGHEIILLDSCVPVWYPDCGTIGQPFLHLHMRIHYRQVLSLHFEIFISAARKNIYCPLRGTLWSIGPSNVSTIWKIVQYQNQVNSQLIGKVHICEWVWVSGFWEGLATWKISLTIDPFDSLAIIRSHSFWHWPWLTWNGSQIVPNRIKPKIIPTLKYFWRFDWQ